MNFGIKINGGFLDLFPKSVVSFQTNNLIFSGTSADVLPGSFQIPLDVPLSRNNRMLLNNPHLVDNADALMEDEYCEIIAGGGMLWQAKLTISSANESSAKIYTVINPFADFKNEKIANYIDEDRTGITPAHAKLTAQSPIDYDYIFFPVYNEDFLPEPPYRSDFANRYQNFYDPASGLFGESKDYPIAMPFVRVDYVLEKIFEETRYKFFNRWQIDDALKKIVLYNNYSIYIDTNNDDEPDKWSNIINLKNHVPDITSNEYLKAWIRIFALGLFPDHHASKVELIPIKDILAEAPKHDWTSKVLRGYSINKDKSNTPQSIRFETPSDDRMFSIIDKNFTDLPDDFIVVDDFPDMNAHINSPGGAYFYVKSKGQYFYFFISGISTDLNLTHADLGEEPKRDQNYEFVAKPAPLIDYFFGNDSYQPANLPYVKFPTGPLSVTPVILQSGILPGVDDSDENEVPFRWMVYQGMSADQNGNTYPRASLNESSTHGFTIHGENGIYNTYWRKWHDMLLNGKPLRVTILLSLSDYILFNYKDKVRIDGMEYFVKSMKVSFNSNGLLPIEAELISVI